MSRPRRFTNPGRLTNYEMGWLREEGVYRYALHDDGTRYRVRWTYPWASVSKSFHPSSFDEWRNHRT